MVWMIWKPHISKFPTFLLWPPDIVRSTSASNIPKSFAPRGAPWPSAESTLDSKRLRIWAAVLRLARDSTGEGSKILKLWFGGYRGYSYSSYSSYSSYTLDILGIIIHSESAESGSQPVFEGMTFWVSTTQVTQNWVATKNCLEPAPWLAAVIDKSSDLTVLLQPLHCIYRPQVEEAWKAGGLCEASEGGVSTFVSTFVSRFGCEYDALPGDKSIASKGILGLLADRSMWTRTGGNWKGGFVMEGRVLLTARWGAGLAEFKAKEPKEVPPRLEFHEDVDQDQTDRTTPRMTAPSGSPVARRNLHGLGGPLFRSSGGLWLLGGPGTHASGVGVWSRQGPEIVLDERCPAPWAHESVPWKIRIASICRLVTSSVFVVFETFRNIPRRSLWWSQIPAVQGLTPINSKTSHWSRRGSDESLYHHLWVTDGNRLTHNLSRLFPHDLGADQPLKWVGYGRLDKQ